MPMNFNFPLASAVLDGVNAANANRIRTTLRDMINAYPQGVIDAPFLTNHDMVRVATNLKDDAARLRSAAAILLALPGAPFLYYGEELGMQNGPGGEDEQKRTPMPWDASAGGGFTTGTPWHGLAPGHETANVAAETRDPGSLLSHYRRLIRLRHGSRALRRGRLELLTTEGPVLAYLLTDGDERVLVAHNLGDEPVRAALAAPGVAQPLLVPDGALLAPDGVALPGHGSGIWRLK